MFISPSVASGNMLNVEQEVHFICNHFHEIHVDIEDGVCFPNNISFGFKLAKAICRISTVPVSLHLMVHDPLAWINDVRECNAQYVFVHMDHVADPLAVLKSYQNHGIPIGLGLSNRDLGKDWRSWASHVTAALVLTAKVEDPLQEFDLSLAQFAVEVAKGSCLQVWADGAIEYHMLPQLAADGIHACVMGRAIYRDKEKACLEAKNWKL